MRFGDAARRDVERRFTYRRMIDDLRNVYTEALGLRAKVTLSMR